MFKRIYPITYISSSCRYPRGQLGPGPRDPTTARGDPRRYVAAGSAQTLAPRSVLFTRLLFCDVIFLSSLLLFCDPSIYFIPSAVL